MSKNPTDPATRPAVPPRVPVAVSPATRRTAIMVVSVIAVVAAYVSFRHQYGLAISAGEPAAMAWTLPVLIDGVIFMASLVMLDTSRRGQRSPWLARLALTAGALATLAANVAEGWSGGWVSRLISAVAPVVLVVSYELLMGMLRRSPHVAAAPASTSVEETDNREEETDDQQDDEPDHPEPVVPSTVEEAARLAYGASVLTREPLSERKLSDRFKLTRGAARSIIGEVVTKAVSSHLAGTGELPDADRLARLNGITVRRAAELLDAVAAEQPAAAVEEAAETTGEERPVRWGDRVVPVSSQDDANDAGTPPSPEVRQRIARMRNEALMHYGPDTSANGSSATGTGVAP